MAVDAVRYRSRRRADDRAAKERKQKILLAACVPILLLLLALEGPKTLKKLHGSSPAPVAPPAASTPAATSAPGAAAAAAAVKAKAAAVRRLPAKDPFVTQVGAQPATSSSPPPQVTPPAVRESHFVAKDPFVQQVVAGTPAAPGAATPPGDGSSGAPGSAGGTGSGDYIVVIASIPLADGRGAAGRAAAEARARGVAGVAIVNSSSYPTLRTGFYAVYAGPYPTLDALRPALEVVRGHGYPSAYTRRLAR